MISIIFYLLNLIETILDEIEKVVKEFFNGDQHFEMAGKDFRDKVRANIKEFRAKIEGK